MGQAHHLSRREILNSIWALGSGSLLLPLSALQGESQNTQAPAVIRGALRDGATGKPNFYINHGEHGGHGEEQKR
jgi:hypothetical protein